MNTKPFNFSVDSYLAMLPEGYDRTQIKSVSQPLPAGTVKLGLTSTDGEEYSQSQTVEDVKAHQRNQIIDSIVTDNLKSLALTLMENLKAVRELWHGAKEREDGSMTITGNDIIERDFVYNSVDDRPGRQVEERLVFRARVTTNGSLTYAFGTHITYPVLLTIVGDVEKMVTPGNETPGTDLPPVNPNPGTDTPVFPNVTNFEVSQTSPGLARLTWAAPATDAYVTQYTVQITEMAEDGAMEMSYPNLEEATFSVVSGSEYTVTISYRINGFEGGWTSFNFTAE